jgi:hypothetical protein
MWKMKFEADMVIMGLYKAFQPEFNAELPTKDKMAFDLTDDIKKKQHNAVKKNQKTLMQLVLSFNNVSLLNKLSCKKVGTRSIGQPERPTTSCRY